MFTLSVFSLFWRSQGNRRYFVAFPQRCLTVSGAQARVRDVLSRWGPRGQCIRSTVHSPAQDPGHKSFQRRIQGWGTKDTPLHRDRSRGGGPRTHLSTGTDPGTGDQGHTSPQGQIQGRGTKDTPLHRDRSRGGGPRTHLCTGTDPGAGDQGQGVGSLSREPNPWIHPCRPHHATDRPCPATIAAGNCGLIVNGVTGQCPLWAVEMGPVRSCEVHGNAGVSMFVCSQPYLGAAVPFHTHVPPLTDCSRPCMPWSQSVLSR